VQCSSCLSFFLSASNAAPICKATIISLEPCALNAEFLLSFSISFPDLMSFLTWWIPLKDRFGGERRPKERVTLQIILVLTLTHPKTFTPGSCKEYVTNIYTGLV
jgi:hypothetical protein